jgi:hypothetical protein
MDQGIVCFVDITRGFGGVNLQRLIPIKTNFRIVQVWHPSFHWWWRRSADGTPPNQITARPVRKLMQSSPALIPQQSAPRRSWFPVRLCWNDSSRASPPPARPLRTAPGCGDCMIGMRVVVPLIHAILRRSYHTTRYRTRHSGNRVFGVQKAGRRLSLTHATSRSRDEPTRRIDPRRSLRERDGSSRPGSRFKVSDDGTRPWMTSARISLPIAFDKAEVGSGSNALGRVKYRRGAKLVTPHPCCRGLEVAIDSRDGSDRCMSRSQGARRNPGMSNRRHHISEARHRL